MENKFFDFILSNLLKLKTTPNHFMLLNPNINLKFNKNLNLFNEIENNIGLNIAEKKYILDKEEILLVGKNPNLILIFYGKNQIKYKQCIKKIIQIVYKSDKIVRFVADNVYILQDKDMIQIGKIFNNKQWILFYLQ